MREEEDRKAGIELANALFRTLDRDEDAMGIVATLLGLMICDCSDLEMARARAHLLVDRVVAEEQSRGKTKH